VSLRIKKLFDLSSADLSCDAIWVDAEYGDWFPGCPSLPEGLDEDDAVEIPVDCYRRLDALREVGRFYVKCDLCFAEGTVYPGLAGIRASDLQPYCVDVFHEGEWLPIAHQARGLFGSEERAAIGNAFQTRLENIYPLRVLVDVAGLPAIAAVFELTEE
jgi:hypothetical protein